RASGRSPDRSFGALQSPNASEGDSLQGGEDFFGGADAGRCEGVTNCHTRWSAGGLRVILAPSGVRDRGGGRYSLQGARCRGQGSTASNSASRRARGSSM